VNSIVKTPSNRILQSDDPSLLHQFFDRAVDQWPERIAVDVPPGIGRPDRRFVTYRELQQQSDKLAALLSTLVTGECVVAILLARRSEHLYSSQLAVLKAGAAYTCIDPAFPDEQVRDILKDADAVALLTNNAGLVRAKSLGFSGQVYDVAELTNPAGDAVVDPPIRSWLAPSSLAYIIYTSGTTGRPKGVMIEHGSISNLVSADLREFDLSTEDRVGQNSSPAYDSSVEEIWLAFAAGATVVVMDDDTTRMGPDLVPWLRSEGITVFCPPPTLLRTTGCDDPLSALPDLSFLYVGGEALPDDVADRWARGRRLVNGYGPTECSVTAVRARIREGQPITIGRPVRGLQAWVLNEMLEEVDDGQRGELCIGGIGLARGYRNRPELTAKKFPVHSRLGRIYRTGDLVHRDPDGSFFYHGRIDSQVKLRGYRVELEAIEAKLAECEGVREAACRVQQNGSLQMLVAFVVPEDGHKPKFDDLKKSLLKALPAYMVPSRFAILDDLPTTVGGKLNRHALPLLETQDAQRDKRKVSPRSLMEEKVEAAFCEVLRLNSGVDIHDDFFNDLGGDSLNAAELISLLRNDPATASITVRDLYEARSVAELAKRAHVDEIADEMFEDDPAQSTGHPFLATSVQIIWLLIGLVLGSLAAYLAAFHALPFLLRGLGLVPFLLLSPLLVFMSLVVYTPVALLNAVMMKRLLIGRYRPLRAPVWGSFYVRNWMVQQAVRIIPWRLFQGTVFQIAALRALGARIGSRVHIHGGVNLLQGGWDLLEIGDDVTLSQDAAVRLVALDDGHMIVGAISLGEGSTLDVRAGVSGDTILEPEAFLTALSNLAGGGVIPRGERWDGIPAMPAGQSPPRPALPAGERIVSPFRHGIALVAARLGFWLIAGLALVLPAIGLALFHEVDANDFLSWLSSPSHSLSVLAAAFMMVTLPVPLTVGIQALAMRAMGRISPGVISRWGYGYMRVCLKTRIVQSAGEWLSGTLFWPLWLRLAGMKIGRGCEISTIIDVVPELIEIGNESFFADGIYLSGPRVHRGTVTLAETRLGENTFLGNHVVVPAGQRLPDNVLIGICTVADDTVIRRDTAWFGHAPFELPRREVIEFDRRLTHDPSLIRYIDRVFWELLRSALLVVPLLILPVWFHFLEAAKGKVSGQLFFVAVVPLVSLATVASLCLLVLVLKWGLLGRVRPGMHAFWSCWCSRWDFLYVAWAFYAYGPLSFLEGTLLLSWYLRAMGARIGRRVILGGGFAQVVDPDMLQFEDGATVSCQFQAHTFEDRVLKIDRVMIRRRATLGSGTVLLYGADIGARTQVAPHSVVMKRESLLPGHSYSGCPTRPVKSRQDFAQAQHSSERQAEYSTLG
jgi:non-ribosomal peptide synthetase-like protein